MTCVGGLDDLSANHRHPDTARVDQPLSSVLPPQQPRPNPSHDQTRGPATPFSLSTIASPPHEVGPFVNYRNRTRSARFSAFAMKYGIAVAALLSAAQGLSFFGNDAVTANEDLKVPGDSPLELCDKDHSDDLVDITRVDLLPNPPEAGADLVIKATGTVFETIEEGAYVNLSVKYGLIRLISTTADLCEQIQNVDLKCPIEKGILSITKSVELPKEIPPGKYTVLADVYDKDDKPITCLTAQVVFGRKDKSAKSTPLEIEL